MFKVTIRPELREDFEMGFSSISVEAVQTEKGFVSCTIGYPTKWNHNEYTIVTIWKDEEALMAFAGESYNQAVIPKGMEKCPRSFSVEPIPKPLL